MYAGSNPATHLSVDAGCHRCPSACQYTRSSAGPKMAQANLTSGSDVYKAQTIDIIACIVILHCAYTSLAPHDSYLTRTP
jgi:hypothetical protein